MKHLYLITSLLFITAHFLFAQTPQVEFNGFIKSDSLAGIGIRNVVANADGTLVVDSNSITSSSIELRDSSGDLRFRLDANQGLFQMLNSGDTIYALQTIDTFTIDTTVLRQLNNIKLAGHDKRNTTYKADDDNVLSDARFKKLAREMRAALLANFAKVNDIIGIDIRLPALNVTDLYSIKRISGIEQIGLRSFHHYYITQTNPSTGKLDHIDINIAGGDHVILRLDENGVVFNICLETEDGLEEFDLSETCELVKTQSVDKSGGDETFTKLKNGDGSKTTTVKGGSIEVSDFSGTPSSGIIGPQNIAVVKGTDVVVFDPFKLVYIGPGGSVSTNVNTATKKVDSGAADYCANSFTSTSDRRLKRDFKTVEPTLSDIIKLNPQSYIMDVKGREGTREIGLIAQDVKKIYPHLVSLNETPHEDISDDPYLTLNYIGLIPILTKGIQELAGQNEEFLSRLTYLQDEIDEQQVLIDHILKQLESNKQ